MSKTLADLKKSLLDTFSPVTQTVKNAWDYSFNTPDRGFQAIAKQVSNNPGKYFVYSPQTVNSAVTSAQEIENSKIPGLSQGAAYLKNQIFKPAATIYDPKAGALDKTLAGVQLMFNGRFPGTAAKWQAWQGTKSAINEARLGNNPIKGFEQGFVGNTNIGLGDALTPNNAPLRTTLNVGEFVVPLMAPYAASKLKAKPVVKNLVEESKTVNPKQATKAQDKIDDLLAEWTGKKEAAKTRGLIEAQPFTEIANSKEVIRGIENPRLKTSEQTKRVITQLKDKFDDLYKEARAAGVDLGYRKDYITHIWDRPAEEVAAMYKSMRGKFKFAKERIYPTYEEGIKMGLVPKYDHPSQILAEYVAKLEKAKADINFFKKLESTGVISNQRLANGWLPITAPGFPNTKETFYASPQVAALLNKVFGEPIDYGLVGKGVKSLADISKASQDITLSGGIPGTPLNAFATAQGTKEALSGRVISPIKSIFANDDYFRQNLPTIQKMQENNIPVATSYNIDKLVQKSVGEKIKGFFSSSFEQKWETLQGNPTFRRYLPALQINLFKDVERNAIRMGKSPQEAVNIASKAVKKFYGVITSDEIAKADKLLENTKGALFFAPRYREGMINFWINNVKSIVPVALKDGKVVFNNPLALENVQNTRFVIGSLITLFSMDKLNRYLNDGRGMLDNPISDQDKLLVPVSKLTGNDNDKMVLKIPFLSSIATVPRTVFRVGRAAMTGDFPEMGKQVAPIFSQPIQLASQLFNNQDYFGNEIYDMNDPGITRLQNQTTYAARSLMQPYMRSGIDLVKNIMAGGDTTQKKSGNAFIDALSPGRVKPKYQIALETMEAPIRFAPNGVSGSYYYEFKDKVLKSADETTRNDYNALHDGTSPLTVANDGAGLQERMTKASIRLNNPSVYYAERLIATETAKRTGQPIDPLYTAPLETVIAYFRYQSLGGSSLNSADAKALYKARPDIGELATARSQFFTQNPLPTTSQPDGRPLPSEYVQKQMDVANWSDPQVKSYLDANSAWKDQQRLSLGLTPADAFGFARKPKKYPGVRVSKGKKIKIAKIKSKKLAIKKPKAIKVKAFKPTKKIAVKKTNQVNKLPNYI